MEEGTTKVAGNLDVLAAHSKAYFALASTNQNYPEERRELAHEMAEYIRAETKSIGDNRIFRIRTNQEAYNASRLEYSKAADRLLDGADKGLEELVIRHSEENIEFAEHVCSSYDTMASMFRKLIEMEAVSETGGEPVDSGYLQIASYNLNVAGRALLQSAHRAWLDDAADRGKLYTEMNAKFLDRFNGGAARADGEKFDGYDQKADDGRRTIAALLATSYQLCKDGEKVTPKKFGTLVEQYKTSMTPAKPQAGMEFA